MTIDGIKIKKREVNSERERDGLKIPHKLREIEFTPPAELQFIQKNDDVGEDFGSGR